MSPALQQLIEAPVDGGVEGLLLREVSHLALEARLLHPRRERVHVAEDERLGDRADRRDGVPNDVIAALPLCQRRGISSSAEKRKSGSRGTMRTARSALLVLDCIATVAAPLAMTYLPEVTDWVLP